MQSIRCGLLLQTLRGLSVYMSDTIMSSAKTDELIDSRLGCGLGWAQETMLGPRSPGVYGQFLENMYHPTVKYRQTFR